MVQKNSLEFKPVVLIGGATGVGKSEIAIELAKKINGEIISADSMQIYSGFDVGTAKLSNSQMCNIKHYLIDIKDGKEFYSVAEFKKDAYDCIKQIQQKGKLPIVVGGTGLYLNSLLFNYKFGGKGKTEKSQPEFDFLPFVITQEREIVYKNIESRVDKMIKDGLIKEIDQLLKKGFSFEDAPFRAIGYKEFKDYYSKEQSLDYCIDLLKKNTRHYAKRQETWFKQWKNLAYFVEPNVLKVIEITEEFFKNGNQSKNN